MKISKRIYLASFLMLLPMAARADATVDNYLKSRDGAIASLSRTINHEWTNADTIKEKKALSLLDKMIVKIVGPIGLQGFPKYGIANLDAISPGVDMGRLDGLKAVSNDGKTTVIVTTKELFDAWLLNTYKRELIAEKITHIHIPATDLYFSAFATNAAVVKAADIPTPGYYDDQAKAILFQYAQDSVGYNPPNKIGVTVRAGNRVFVFVKNVNVHNYPECETELNSLQDENELKHLQEKAISKTVELNSQEVRALSAAYDAADLRATTCVKEHIAKSPEFSDIRQQADELLKLPFKK